MNGWIIVQLFQVVYIEVLLQEMSHLIDSMDDTELYPNHINSNRYNLSFQSLTNYLQSFNSTNQSLKYFHVKGQRCDIVIQINLFKQLPIVVQKIQIDRKRLTYQSKFVLKMGSQIIICQTKCLRLMIIKQLQSLKKKMKMHSYSLTVDQHSGQIIGKNIFSITPNTNINQLLMCQLIPLRNHLSRFLTIVLSIINCLPPLYSELLHEKTKNVNQVNIQQRIQKRIYKYYYRSIVQFWRSYSKVPSQSFEDPQDKQLQEKLQKQIPSGFIQQSSQLYNHRPKNKFKAQYKFDFTPQENTSIQIHLRIPMTSGRKSQNNFIFNQIKVIQQSNQAADSRLRGASTKILISKLNFFYLNTLPNPNENHNNRQVNTKQYTKLVGIKVPLQKLTAERAKKKSDHEIKILKLFSQIQSPFLLRYFVCTSPSFKYSNMLMMNFLNNCDTVTSFLSNRKQVLSFSSKLYVMINILQALRLIKQYGVVHMDLSPSNILVNPNYITQLIDFGESYHAKFCDKDYNPGYTLPFSFPEKFSQKKFTSKSDMFSFGMLTFYAIFSALPYAPTQKLVKSLQNFTYREKFFFAPQSVEYYGYRKIMIFLFSFIQRCIDPNPILRPHPTWAIIIFKQLYFWLEEVSIMI